MTGHMSVKHVPERTCIACGAKRPQRDLLRLVSQGGAPPVVDAKGKASGRGAYVCLALACAETAFKRRALERALRLTEPVSVEFKQELRDMLANVTVPVTEAPEPQAAPVEIKAKISAAATGGV